jgi:ketosteroid isomerase-like protein
MSQENVEIVRRAYEAWNRGDLNWIANRVRDDCEMRPLRFFDLDEVYRGKEGFLGFTKIWRDAWDEITVTIEQIHDLGDRLLALLTFSGTGRASGIEVSLRLGHLITVENGLLTQLLVIEGWEEALEAAGLRQ